MRGVGLGEIWVAPIGPERNPELLVAGQAVLDAMRAKRDAKPGLAIGSLIIGGATLLLMIAALVVTASLL